MAYFAYLGKEYGIAKIGIVILGLVVLILGLYSYLASPWVSNDVHKLCGILNSGNLTNNATGELIIINSSCPSIHLEKAFVVGTVFTFSLSLLGLIGNVMSRDLSEGYFKLGDIVYSVLSAVLLITCGSLFLYSTTSIDSLFNEIGQLECVQDIVGGQSYQKYGEKVWAGSLSIIQGLLYVGVALLLFFR